MSIEEAEYILTEAVIEHPSINSYTYISSKEINIAINRILEEKLKNENEIKVLENKIIEERNNFKDIIKEREIEIEELKNRKYNSTYIKKIIKYIKKVVNPLFLLEN